MRHRAFGAPRSYKSPAKKSSIGVSIRVGDDVTALPTLRIVLPDASMDDEQSNALTRTKGLRSSMRCRRATRSITRWWH
jgi:hypothetical protein